MSAFQYHPASYRDPAGFVFELEGKLYRQINNIYRTQYAQLMQSGCYAHLVNKGWLLPHTELNNNPTGEPDAFCTIEPDRLFFISHPSEWSFDMLRDAALLTLSILREALNHEMVLKDATPFNIQFRNGQPVLIDTLSFEHYHANEPWIAYRQFCEQFLAPLVLMHYTGQSLPQLLLAYPEGIPVRTAAALLPRRSRWSLHINLHIHLHARVSKRVGQEKQSSSTARAFSKTKLLNLIDSLESAVHRCRLKEADTAWSGYYTEAATREGYLVAKKELVEKMMAAVPNIHTVADLGANDGLFARLAAEKGKQVIAADQDAACINRLYHELKKTGLPVQPLILDLAAPTPATGFRNKERASFISRCNADLVLALALIHHLCIGRNIPLPMVAAFFQDLSPWLIIEFVPADDEKTKVLLAAKQRTYTGYTEAGFEEAFGTHFSIEQKLTIPHSNRILYLLKRK